MASRKNNTNARPNLEESGYRGCGIPGIDAVVRDNIERGGFLFFVPERQGLLQSGGCGQRGQQQGAKQGKQQNKHNSKRRAA